MKSAITTHILDVQLGKPAANVLVTLYRKQGEQFEQIAQDKTNADDSAKPNKTETKPAPLKDAPQLDTNKEEQA